MRLLGIAFETRSRRSITADTPRDAIATAIIGFARAGERDPERWVGSVGGGLRKLNLLGLEPANPSASYLIGIA